MMIVMIIMALDVVVVVVVVVGRDGEVVVVSALSVSAGQVTISTPFTPPLLLQLEREQVHCTPLLPNLHSLKYPLK